MPDPRPVARDVQRALRSFLTTNGNPERALDQQQYMKSAMPYAGLTMPDLRKTMRHMCRDFPCADADAWHAVIVLLWRDAQVREERYAALEVLNLPRYRHEFLRPTHMPMLRELITTGAWWDFVDAIAANSVGYLLTNDPQAIRPILYEWCDDPDLWIRRSAILAQLKFKTHTDEALLFHAIERSCDDNDFFARKAIGWALREYSKTSPDKVAAYIANNESRLSALSRREGLKVLQKNGYV